MAGNSPAYQPNPAYSAGTPSYLAQQAAQYAGPLAAPAVQRSIYLAQALDRLSNAGQNLKSGGALATNLMAEALDQYGRARNDRQLQQLAQGGMQRQLTADPIDGVDDPGGASVGIPSASPQGGQGGLLSGLAHLFGLGGSAQPQPQPPQPNPNAAGPGMPSSVGGATQQPVAPPSEPQPKAATDGASAPLSAPASSSATAGQAKGGDPLLAHVVKHFTDEGFSPAAAAGLAGNFAAESNLNPASVNSKEGAFGLANWTGPRKDALLHFAQAAGRDPNDLDTQLAFTDQELAGPESRARRLLMSAQTPEQGAAAGLAYERPAGYRPGGDPAQASRWNVRLGDTQSAFAQSLPPQGPQSTATTSQASPVPRPLQVSTGPDPSVPNASAQGPSGASPFAVQPPDGGAPRGAPQAQPNMAQPAMGGSQQTGFTAQPVPLSPAQIQRYRTLEAMAARDPRYLDQLVAYRNALHTQLATPEELDKTRPNDAGQITVTGKTSGRLYGVISPSGVVVAAGPKMTADGQGGFEPVASTQVQTLPAQDASALGYRPGSVVEHNGATGQNTVAQGPFDLEGNARSFMNGDAYTTLGKTARAVNALQRVLANSRNNNGVVDMGAFDNNLQIETGLSAKVGNAKLLSEAFDLPTALGNQLQKIAGPGSMTPTVLAQMLNATRSYYQAQASAAQRELSDANHRVQMESGGRYRDIGVSLPTIDQTPNVPWMGEANPVNPASPANPPQPASAQEQASILAEARGAIARGAPRQAVVQRLQGLGINPAGL